MITLPRALQEDAQERWQLLHQALQQQGITVSLSNNQIRSIRTALVISDFVYRQILHHPVLWSHLMEHGDLMEPYPENGYRARLNTLFKGRMGFDPMNPSNPPTTEITANDHLAAVRKMFRDFRHREMIRIAVRDICGWADLEETMADLSSLACACLEGALTYAYRRQCTYWGEPMDAAHNPRQMVVLGLGKLGADELNFSSDVDLMFAYAGRGHTRGGTRGSISNGEFHLKTTQELIRIIGETTADGIVFRVDTRLRPYGGSGPLVMHFDSLEDYYQGQGREWERYALIKAKVVAGDPDSGRDLLNRLKPFIYRRYLDFGAFDGLRDMKGRIDMEIKAKGLQDNIKLGPGGIREIEFFGQMFQLIRGGVEPALQIRPIREVLRVLAQGGYISASLQVFLDRAYVFLRTVENRIQQWADQQDHRLPTNPDSQARLAAALGFDGWQSFKLHLDDIRAQVHGHFQQLLAPGSRSEEPVGESEGAKVLEGIWQGIIEADSARKALSALGYRNPELVLQLITALNQDRSTKAMSQVGLNRLTRLVPLVLQTVAGTPQAELVLERIFDLIRGIHKRTAYLALMLENPSILHHLVTLTGASPWIAGLLSRHPVLLDELVDPRTLYRPPLRRELEGEIGQRLAGIDAEDLEYQMEALRIFKQVNLLRVAASDITNVLPLMKVSDHLSDIAEVAVNSVANLCWEQLKRKNGIPDCRLNGAPCDPGFAIISYGKLGGLELGYGSDLDLVFLHTAEAGQTRGGERSIDNTTFFARLGQRVLHMLTTHTATGRLYEVDMRLRPSGDSGMLVSHIEGFAAYQQKEAWTWEHQALLRARPIFGDRQLLEQFERIRREILTRPRDVQRLRADVMDMRTRLRREYAPDNDDQFNIKYSPGGILDIEFIVQYLALMHAHRHPEIIRWTDNVRQLETLNEAGILSHGAAFGLRRTYLIYRAMTHRLGLQQQSALISGDRFLAARRFVSGIWHQFLELG